MTEQEVMLKPEAKFVSGIFSFLDNNLEEIEMCNPDAFEILEKISKDSSYEEILNLVNAFISEYIDDLDACQPDAFDELLPIVEEVGIFL